MKMIPEGRSENSGGENKNSAVVETLGSPQNTITQWPAFHYAEAMHPGDTGLELFLRMKFSTKHAKKLTKSL